MPQLPESLDQLRDKLRVKYYAIRTEQSYAGWIKRYIYFHDKTHPKESGAQDVEAFLTHLAVAGKVVRLYSKPGQECDSVSLSRGAGDSVALVG